MGTRLLFLFLDGLGLGSMDPTINPIARAATPHLDSLLGGGKLVASSAPREADHATLLALDACLGVSGTPQSATGQAALLTGINLPGQLGYHYGPKPNPPIAAALRAGNLFSTLRVAGRQVAFLDAYPPSYFAAVESGRRLHSAIPLAALSAGLRLRTAADLAGGQALAADLTGHGWRERLALNETPVLTLQEAGARMAELAQHYDFSFFEYWLTDYAGHARNMVQACALLSGFDVMLGALLSAWDDRTGLILITSDHGNIEDLSVRGHTLNPVPALVVGAPALRSQLISVWRDITDIAPAIARFLA